MSVVGVSSYGKSRLARSRSQGATWDIPFIELDAIVHQADWVALPDAEFRATAEAATTARRLGGGQRVRRGADSGLGQG